MQSGSETASDDEISFGVFGNSSSDDEEAIFEFDCEDEPSSQSRRSSLPSSFRHNTKAKQFGSLVVINFRQEQVSDAQDRASLVEAVVHDAIVDGVEEVEASRAAPVDNETTMLHAEDVFVPVITVMGSSKEVFQPEALGEHCEVGSNIVGYGDVEGSSDSEIEFGGFTSSDEDDGNLDDESERDLRSRLRFLDLATAAVGAADAGLSELWHITTESALPPSRFDSLPDPELGSEHQAPSIEPEEIQEAPFLLPSQCVVFEGDVWEGMFCKWTDMEESTPAVACASVDVLGAKAVNSADDVPLEDVARVASVSAIVEQEETPTDVWVTEGLFSRWVVETKQLVAVENVEEAREGNKIEKESTNACSDWDVGGDRQTSKEGIFSKWVVEESAYPCHDDACIVILEEASHSVKDIPSSLSAEAKCSPCAGKAVRHSRREYATCSPNAADDHMPTAFESSSAARVVLYYTALHLRDETVGASGQVAGESSEVPVSFGGIAEARTSQLTPPSAIRTALYYSVLSDRTLIKRKEREAREAEEAQRRRREDTERRIREKAARVVQASARTFLRMKREKEREEVIRRLQKAIRDVQATAKARAELAALRSRRTAIILARIDALRTLRGSGESADEGNGLEARVAALRARARQVLSLLEQENEFIRHSCPISEEETAAMEESLAIKRERLQCLRKRRRVVHQRVSKLQKAKTKLDNAVAQLKAGMEAEGVVANGSLDGSDAFRTKEGDKEGETGVHRMMGSPPCTPMQPKDVGLVRAELCVVPVSPMVWAAAAPTPTPSPAPLGENIHNHLAFLSPVCVELGGGDGGALVPPTGVTPSTKKKLVWADGYGLPLAEANRSEYSPHHRMANPVKPAIRKKKNGAKQSRGTPKKQRDMPKERTKAWFRT